MVLCNECAAKVRLNFPRHDLEPIGDGMAYKRCDHCRKGRYCLELELVRRTDGAGVETGRDFNSNPTLSI